MIAQRHIELALSEIRANSKGFSPDAEDTQLGLDLLNGMLGIWSSESILIPYRTRDELTLVAGTATYTIGTGGTLNTARPLEIEYAKLRYNDVDFEINVASVQRFERMPDYVSTGLPVAMEYEPSDPLGRLQFQPVPDVAYTLILWSYKAITQLTVLTTSDDLPAQYDEVIRTNLACRLAPHFGKSCGQDTVRIAEKGLAALRNEHLATRVPTLVVDKSLQRRYRYNINRG